MEYRPVIPVTLVHAADSWKTVLLVVGITIVAGIVVSTQPSLLRISPAWVLHHCPNLESERTAREPTDEFLSHSINKSTV